MKNIIYLALALVASLPAFGQRYSATTGDVSLTGTGTTLTIQQPATPGKQITLESATVYCSVACSVTLAENGAAATATAGALMPVLPSIKPTYATVYTASNVGAGTAVGGIVHLGAAQTVVLDLSKIALGAGTPNANFSISVSSITGTANITLIETEI